MRLAELLREATFGVDLTPLSLASVCTVLTSFTGVFVMCGHVNSYAGAILYYASLLLMYRRVPMYMSQLCLAKLRVM